MYIFKSKLNYNADRDIYWARVKFKSKDKAKTSSLLLCASYEYVGEKVKGQGSNDNKLNAWYDDVVKNWGNKGGQVFRKQYHYDVHAITSAGEKNGLKFLKEEVSANS